mgnify:FL=1
MSSPLNRTWVVRETQFHPQNYPHKETIFTVGNGYVGVRAAFEEGYPGEQATTLVHGIFDHAEGEQVPELVNVPNWLRLTLTVDGAPFSMQSGVHLGYERALDLRRAALTRRVLWQPAFGGPVVRLEFERFASRARQHMMALRIRVTALDRAVSVAAESRLDGAVTNDGVQHWALPWQQGQQRAGDAAQVWLLGQTAQSRYTLGMASWFENDAGAAPAPIDEANIPGARVAFTLGKGQTVTLTKLVALHTSRDAGEPGVRPEHRSGQAVLPMVEATLGAAARAGYDALLAEHEAAWAADWARSDVVIDGDERAQLAIRFALYHLLIAAPWHDETVSIAAKTLSGLGYKGHVFWDTELFMLPPLIHTQPEAARNLLMYRYHNLQGARHKAAAEGYRGAMFPWESTDTGEETTPKWTAPHPVTGERIRIWTGDNEQHITTDIVYAIRQYWAWTGDDAFMRDHGAEIVLDTARFWASRAEYNAAADRYELHNQIGPDEYHENIANSIFVNRMVVWHLDEALRTRDWLRAHHPARAAELDARLELTPDELARWRDIIAKMHIPYDPERRIHVQFDGFFDLEYVEVPAYTPRVASLQWVYGVERTNRLQIVKQADVVMLIALLWEMLAPRDVLLNNWRTYAPRCDHGSSLSAATHAWVAARLGLVDEAYALFEHAAGTDLDDNKGNTAHGIHGATCGGLWQAVALGFGGLHLGADGRPAAQPALPAHWSCLRFRFFHRGRQYELIARQGEPAEIRPL